MFTNFDVCSVLSDSQLLKSEGLKEYSLKYHILSAVSLGTSFARRSFDGEIRLCKVFQKTRGLILQTDRL